MASAKLSLRVIALIPDNKEPSLVFPYRDFFFIFFIWLTWLISINKSSAVLEILFTSLLKVKSPIIVGFFAISILGVNSLSTTLLVNNSIWFCTFSIMLSKFFLFIISESSNFWE